MAKTRKEMEHRQRRQHILECAERLFAEKGFDGVTVADIAKESEFSVGSIYLFFESKEALKSSLLLERMRQVLDVIETQVGADIPALEKFENTVDGIIRVFLEHIDFFKVYAMEVKGSELCCAKGTTGEDFHNMSKKFSSSTASIFEQGIDEGIFREDIDPQYMAFFLDASLHSLVNQVIMSSGDYPFEKVREIMKEMLLYGIMKTPRRRKK